MSHVSVTINGRQYRMACEDGQEAHLMRLAKDLDQRIQEVPLGVFEILGQHGVRVHRCGKLLWSHIFRIDVTSPLTRRSPGEHNPSEPGVVQRAPGG